MFLSYNKDKNMTFTKKLSLPIWMFALVALEDGDHLSKLTWKVMATYAHMSQILHAWIDCDLVTIKKSGRRKIIHLTDKGQNIKEYCSNIAKELNLSQKRGFK